MDKAELVSGEIYKELFEGYLPKKLKSMAEVSPTQVMEKLMPFYKLYQEADSELRKSIQFCLEVIISDTASTILGGLDGCTDLGSLAEEFKIKYGKTDVSGSLQDYFLEKVEARLGKH